MRNLFLNSQLHFVDLDFYFLHCAISSQVFPQAFHSMTRVSGVNETKKKSFIFKRRSLFKDFDLCYATHTVFMFEISLVT